MDKMKRIWKSRDLHLASREYDTGLFVHTLYHHDDPVARVIVDTAEDTTESSGNDLLVRELENYIFSL